MKTSYEKRYGHLRTHRAVHSLRNTKRAEALVRNKAWQSLSTERKLVELRKRPGRCEKQVARLTAKETE